ncbi:myosin heavy chain, cardiac muscle isoform-like isoform X2 [Symsagittifera roscoffensis]|uniref:myosin heavy chain, cardiac muscle isoform-like isoform X2 n=1 Tax=Symsagittifera roscoffensis TaxID=84072 RepID=UPI00307C5DD4
MDFGSKLDSTGSHLADETLDLTNKILDKIDHEMSQLNFNSDFGSRGGKNSKRHEVKSWMARNSSGAGHHDLETVDSVSYVEDCLSTEKDVATFNDTVLSSIVDTEKFPLKPRSKRSKSALGRLNNLDKSLEAEELLRSLIEKRFQTRESPDSTPRLDVPRIKLDEDVKHPKQSGGSMFKEDVGDRIRRRINGGESEVDSVISRHMGSKLDALRNNFNFNSNDHSSKFHTREQHEPAMAFGKLAGSSENETSKLLTKRGRAPHRVNNSRSLGKAKSSIIGQPANTDFGMSNWFGEKLSVGTNSTNSFAMSFKEPPSLLAYMANKPNRMDKWQSFDSLSSQSIKLDSNQFQRSRPLKKIQTFNGRSNSQPVEKSNYRKNDRSTSRFSEFVPKNYELSEIGSATEQEMEYIKAEAARIKFEMESTKNSFNPIGRNMRTRERRHSSSSSISSTPRNFSTKPKPPTRAFSSQPNNSTNDVILKETERSMAKLKDLDLEVQSVLSKKQAANREILELQQKKKELKQEISENEAEIRSQNVAMKKEQHALEMTCEQKTQAERELEQLKRQVEDSKSSWNNQLELNTRQISQLIEENTLLKENMQRGEITQYERYELQRQLEDLREQLRNETTESRMKNHEMNLELKEAEKKLRQYDETNRELISRLEQLDGDYAEKVKKVNEINNFVKNELSDTKTTLGQLADDHERLKQNSNDQNEKLIECENVISERDSEIAELKRINEQLQFELQRMEQSHVETVETMEINMTRDKNAAVDELNSRINELNKKHQSTLEELREEMESIRKQKSNEIEHWKEKLNVQSEATRELGERLRLEAQEQVRAAVVQERTNFESEKSFLVKRERDNFDDELARTTRRLQDAIDYEKKLLSQSHGQVADLKSEIETLRAENRNLYKEATDANLVARESALREHSNEIRTQKEKMEKEYNDKVFELQEQIRLIQDQLELTKVENHNATTRYHDLETRVVQHEKAILLEINEECRRICKMINVNYNRIKKKRTGREANSDSSTNPTSAVINSTTEAVINLKACVSELQTYVFELREEADGAKLKSQQTKEKTEMYIRSVREELNAEHQRKIEDLREKLNLAHMEEISKMQEDMMEQDLHDELRELKKENSDLRSEMSKFKRDTAEKLAKQFEKEVNSMVESRLKSDNYIPRRHYAELEREHKRLVAATESQHKSGGRVGVMGGSGGSEDSSSTASLQLLRHLQQKVNALKDENSRLKMTVSMNNSMQGIPPRAAPPSD